MKKGDIIENILIEKLVYGGKGYAKLNQKNEDTDTEDNRVLFITGNPIPLSIVNLKITKKRTNYYETQITETIKKSKIEQENKNNIYGISGGWKWINIPYEEQLKIKENQIIESFYNIKKIQKDIYINSIIPSPIIDGYRNKVEFSFGKFISKKYDIEKHFNVGFHKQGEFSKVEDFDGTPLIDLLQNEIYKEIKIFSKTLGLPVYDQMKHEGFFRHLLIRRTYFTDEIMILLSFNTNYFNNNNKINKKEKLENIKFFLIKLTKKYSQIKSIYFSHNPNKADTCIGDLELIYGKNTIKETLHGLVFNISPTSFFQTNSKGAEKLYNIVLDFAKGKIFNNLTILDLYGGTGTIGMIFAKAGAKIVYSVELVKSASNDGKQNAKLNKLNNIEFFNSKVENFLGDHLNNNTLSSGKADLLIIDPPRVGMHPKALEDILKFHTSQIIYVSCNPGTLSRDLEYIINNSNYIIEKIQPIDMFPHTCHIETVVSLILRNDLKNI